jgi:sugar phosphate isomerase/epimerase
LIVLSCADYTFPLLTRAKRFALLNLLGLNYVDLGLFERSSDLRPAQLVADPRRFIRQLRHDLKNAGLHCSDVFLQIGVEPAISEANNRNPQVRARNRRTFLRTLDLCAALGCTHLTGLPGIPHNGPAESDDMSLAVDEAGWRQQAAADAGITYAIEAHMGSLCSDVASTHAFIKAVPGLTLTLDYGHFVAMDVPSREIHSLLPFASHFHVRGGAPGRLQTPVSENRIDFSGMVRRLYKQNYRGFIALEYVWTDWQQCNRVDNLSETILLRRLLKEVSAMNSKTRRPRRKTARV